MKTRGAGGGKPLVQGEMGEGEFSGQLLRISFSGDSTSLSSIRMSALIRCAKGEGAFGESEKGRFLTP